MDRQASRLALAVLVMVVAGGRAVADTTAPPPTAAQEAEAKRLYLEGTKSFSLAEYADAIRYYRAAYKIVPQPLFLYDIGQAYRLAKDYEQAEGFYQSFLFNLPSAPNRAEVETLIEQMDAAIASQPKAAPGGSARVPSPVEAARLSPAVAAPARRLPAPPAETRRPPIYRRWWFWAGVGAVAVGATVAVVAGSGGGNGAPASGLGTSKVFN